MINSYPFIDDCLLRSSRSLVESMLSIYRMSYNLLFVQDWSYIEHWSYEWGSWHFRVESNSNNIVRHWVDLVYSYVSIQLCMLFNIINARILSSVNPIVTIGSTYEQTIDEHSSTMENDANNHDMMRKRRRNKKNTTNCSYVVKKITSNTNRNVCHFFDVINVRMNVCQWLNRLGICMSLDMIKRNIKDTFIHRYWSRISLENSYPMISGIQINNEQSTIESNLNRIECACVHVNTVVWHASYSHVFKYRQFNTCCSFIWWYQLSLFSSSFVLHTSVKHTIVCTNWNMRVHSSR
jgi:hypothetical protein